VPCGASMPIGARCFQGAQQAKQCEEGEQVIGLKPFEACRHSAASLYVRADCGGMPSSDARLSANLTNASSRAKPQMPYLAFKMSNICGESLPSKAKAMD